MAHYFSRLAASATVFLATAGLPATAQDHAINDRIAATIAAHEDSSPVTKWNPDHWADMTVDDFLTLVPAPLRRALGRAWEAAGEGSLSGSTCSGLFMGMGTRLENEATEADDLAVSMQGIDTCHVAVLARYLSVRLDPEQASDGCTGEMVAVTVHRNVAGSLLRDADPDGVILEYLDTRLDAVIGELVRSACPDVVSDILGPAA